jgi:hypothetical protein
MSSVSSDPGAQTAEVTVVGLGSDRAAPRAGHDPVAQTNGNLQRAARRPRAPRSD